MTEHSDFFADRSDEDLAAAAAAGEREALEALLIRSERWVFNLILRMVWDREDARDLTQDVLLKAVAGLPSFEGRSKFRTWLYRIAANHVLNAKVRKSEEASAGFESFASDLDAMEDADFPDPNTLPADARLILEEVRIGCMSGMLLCLDREQRLVFVLGEILGVRSDEGAEIAGITPANFRQRLTRARRDLYAFMNQQCGLVRKENPCRCARKTAAFIRAGAVDPADLKFAGAHLRMVAAVAPAAADLLDDLEAEYAELFRRQPYHESVGVARRILGTPEVARLLRMPS